jgi:hypothetical protein
LRIKQQGFLFLVGTESFMATDDNKEEKKQKRFKHPSKEEQTTDLSSLDKLGDKLGIPKVPAPKDLCVVVFPGPDGKVDMIDAADQLYGIEPDEGDVVIRIRDGKVV